MATIGVIGGGAAGMAVSVFAAQKGLTVHLFEQNEKLGKKLFITGKGRCNFTNDCAAQELFAHVVTNPRFLYSAFGTWNSRQTIQWMEELGVRTKVERGGRAFPASDHSSDIIRALARRMTELGVVVHLGSEVRALLTEEAPAPAGEAKAAAEAAAPPREQVRAAQPKKGPVTRVTGVRLANGAALHFDAVVLATGGLSYPLTGAAGTGLAMAERVGHTVTPTRPALVPLVTAEPYIPALQGLSLRNVTLTIPYGKKKRFSAFGELLFTHYGLSGPLALSASSYIGRALEEGPLPAQIDLKPALTDEQLDARLLREFAASPNKDFKNAVAPLFPAKLRPVMVQLSGVPEDLPVHEVTRAQRETLLRLVRAFPMTITGLRGWNEAIITQGGVSVKEINPSTMASKRAEGLYVIGEALDVDAVTGGFNLQIAWATAHVCAENIGLLCNK